MNDDSTSPNSNFSQTSTDINSVTTPQQPSQPEPLTFKSPETMSTLSNSLNKQVMIKGNLTRETNVINVSEVNTFENIIR